MVPILKEGFARDFLELCEKHGAKVKTIDAGKLADLGFPVPAAAQGAQVGMVDFSAVVDTRGAN